MYSIILSPSFESKTPFEFWGRLTAFACPLDKFIISFLRISRHNKLVFYKKSAQPAPCGFLTVYLTVRQAFVDQSE